MKLTQQRRRVLMTSALVIVILAGVAFIGWLPDQRFVGTWTVHGPGMDGRWMVRYEWNGSGAFRDPAKGVWRPSRWYAKRGQYRLPYLEKAPTTWSERLTSIADRLRQRGWNEYEILSVSDDAIELRTVQMHEHVTLRRVIEPATERNGGNMRNNVF